jgi:hypothetical protein
LAVAACKEVERSGGPQPRVGVERSVAPLNREADRRCQVEEELLDKGYMRLPHPESIRKGGLGREVAEPETRGAPADTDTGESFYQKEPKLRRLRAA